MSARFEPIMLFLWESVQFLNLSNIEAGGSWCECLSAGYVHPNSDQYGTTAMCLFKKIVTSLFLYASLKLLHCHHLNINKQTQKEKKKEKPKLMSPKYFAISPLLRHTGNE